MNIVFMYSRLEDNLEESGEAKKSKMQVKAMNTDAS